jgi:translation initiation factor 5B
VILLQPQDEVQADYASILSKVDRSGKGVSVQASTLGTQPLVYRITCLGHAHLVSHWPGSLEALITFLGDMKIPVSAINIGSIHKKDIMRAAVMLEHKVE